MMAPLFVRKILVLMLSALIAFSCRTSRSVTDELVGSKSDKSAWKSPRRNKREAFNPYLKKKASEKPSGVQARENKKAIKQAKRAIRKQKRMLRRTKGAYKKP